MQPDGLNSTLSPVIYGDVVLSINTITITTFTIVKKKKNFNQTLRDTIV